MGGRERGGIGIEALDNFLHIVAVLHSVATVKAFQVVDCSTCFDFALHQLTMVVVAMLYGPSSY